MDWALFWSSAGYIWGSLIALAAVISLFYWIGEEFGEDAVVCSVIFCFIWAAVVGVYFSRLHARRLPAEAPQVQQ